jgi:XTP/dITP diphosphohydrolase
MDPWSILDIMKLFLASNNKHKKVELERIFKGHDILLPVEAGIRYSHRETGLTYLENAMGKAMTLFGQAGGPVLADDSGLSVPALDGKPGTCSARYGGKDLTDRDRYRYLLKNMRSVEDRRAFFVCCIVLLLDENRFFVAQETFAGSIAMQPSGKGGFGYDPVFYIPQMGCTVAELEDGSKDRISHRGLAARRLLRLLDSL